MMKKKNALRFIVSGCLLAAVVMVGISVYQVEKNQVKRSETKEHAQLDQTSVEKEEEHLGGNHSATVDEESNLAAVEDEEEEIPESEETTAELENEEESVETSQTTIIVPEVNFTEDTLLDWPVNGTVLMDYSMDHTVYFPTLDVYKYNPSVLLHAEVGDPVEAAANGKILKIEENMETGMTITADLGNGYQAIYGQLKDVLVKENDIVTAGTVLGYVSEPSRFYTEEGTNLYFAMTKDGKSIDPILYLP